MKARRLVMDDMDDAMLSLALRDAYPRMVFFPSGSPLFVPDLGLRATIPECDSGVVGAFVPEPGWEPRFERDTRYPDWFRLQNPPKLSFNYSRTHWFWRSWEPAHWAFDPPTPEAGAISTGYDPDDAEERAYVNKVWNILGKLATNRVKSGISRDRVVLQKDAGGKMCWPGHHMLEWCAAAPRRMIEGAFRPCDDWAPPDTLWYRNLRDRAETIFGAHFGGPPEPEHHRTPVAVPIAPDPGGATADAPGRS